MSNIINNTKIITNTTNISTAICKQNEQIENKQYRYNYNSIENIKRPS